LLSTSAEMLLKFLSAMLWQVFTNLFLKLFCFILIYPEQHVKLKKIIGLLLDNIIWVPPFSFTP